MKVKSKQWDMELHERIEEEKAKLKRRIEFTDRRKKRYLREDTIRGIHEMN